MWEKDWRISLDDITRYRIKEPPTCPIPKQLFSTLLILPTAPHSLHTKRRWEIQAPLKS